MPQVIEGPFDIKSTPHPPNEAANGLSAMRMTFHKTFHGDLAGTSVVEMIGTMNRDIGSGAYVAIECFSGAIQGKKGSFYLQHSSTMDRGKPTQSVTVVPDTGTEELKGLTGSMVITIAEGKHFYRLEYSL